MKRILVPTDFSKYARNALTTAFLVARKTEGHVLVLHVIPNLDHILLRSDSPKKNQELENQLVGVIKDNARREINRWMEHEQFPEEQVEIRVVVGNVHQTIIQEAERTATELIVMGTQGTRPIEEMVVGSNTEKVVRFAPCPVLSVREEPINFITAKILFPTDFKDAPPYAIGMLKKFQLLFDAHIHLLYVNTPFGFVDEEKIKERKEHFVVETQLENHTLHIINTQRTESGIQLAAKDLEVDMIALLTHQRRGLAHFFVGSTAEDVVNHAYQPVLTIGRDLEASDQ